MLLKIFKEMWLENFFVKVKNFSGIFLACLNYPEYLISSEKLFTLFDVEHLFFSLK